MITLSEYSWLQGFSFFLFSTLNMSCHSHQACKVPAEKAVDDLGRVPLYVTSDRNSKDLTETEEIKQRWQEYIEKLYKKGLVCMVICSILSNSL